MKLIICLLFSLNCFGFVVSRSESGAEVKWTQSSKNLYLNVNPTPISTNIDLDISSSAISSMGLSEQEYIGLRVQEIFDESLEQWNTVSPYELKPLYGSYSSVSLTDSANSVAFSNSYSFFSSGVLAITSLSYQADEGKINSADILINQSYNNYIDFTLNETSSSREKAYLGDVLTHEVGHLLGLAHSETIGASMAYSIFKNQHTISEDDKHGILASYKSKLTNGTITGSVISNTGSPIFGAYVKLLSILDNEIVQGQYTNEQGVFLFDNVDTAGSYSILVLPAKKLEVLPAYYQNVKTDYCAGKDFVPSFFYTCGPRGKSRPQVIAMEDDLVELGALTIRCDENLNSQYLASKLNDEKFELNNNSRKSNFNFVGMFFEDEVSSSSSDIFTLDLTNKNVSLDSNLVKFNFMSTGLGSLMKLSVSIERADGASQFMVVETDETGKTLTDISATMNLSSFSADNIFEITVTPFELSEDEGYEIFSAPNELKNSNYLYHLGVFIGANEPGGFIALNTPDSYPYEDNNSCAEGTLSFSADAYTPLSTARGDGAQSNDDDAFSCATVDLGDDGPSSGPLSFIMGLIIFFLAKRSPRFFLS